MKIWSENRELAFGRDDYGGRGKIYDFDDYDDEDKRRSERPDEDDEDEHSDKNDDKNKDDCMIYISVCFENKR